MDTPNVARIYDFFLGGKDNFAADRDAARKIEAHTPNARRLIVANRAFLTRAVRYLAYGGIGQFVDIGTGLPTRGNVHEIAQAVNPKARVVYVDHDPVVVRHAQALLAQDDQTTAILGDLRRPEEFLHAPELKGLIDTGEPVAVLTVAVLHFLTGDDGPYEVMARVREWMPPGSALALSHVRRSKRLDAAAEVYAESDSAAVTRDPRQIRRFFGEFHLVEPGLVPAPRWRPDEPGPTGYGHFLAGVGRKAKTG